MDRKISIKDVHKNIKQDYPELYKTLCARLGDMNPFAKFSIGAGNYVWTDNREQWHRMTDASELKKSMIQDSLEQLKKDVAGKVGGKTAEAIFTTPDESFIYYNDDSDNIKLLITGWGFKKPVRVAVGPETGTVRKKNPISISFIYNGEQLKNYEFGLRLAKQIKKFNTNANGIYVFDNLQVGEKYVVTAIDKNKDFSLHIVEGQSSYSFDITEYSTLNISAVEDGNPVAGETVGVQYHGKQYEAVTDENGRACMQLPFYDKEPVTATLRDKKESTSISSNGARVDFVFQTKIPVEVDKPKEQPPIPVTFNPYILVRRENGNVAEHYPIVIEYEGNIANYETNEEGIVALSGLAEGKTMKVIDRNDRNHAFEFTLNREQQEYLFIIPDEVEVPTKEAIKVMFRDVKGNPVVCNSVTFRQEGKPELNAQLDENAETSFEEGTFETGIPITAHINGWSNREQQTSIPFTLESDEYEYLLQEKESVTKSAWKIFAEILSILVTIAALRLIWPPFEAFCMKMFESIYY